MLAIWCDAVANATPLLEYLRLPLTGHFSWFSSTKPYPIFPVVHNATVHFKPERYPELRRASRFAHPASPECVPQIAQNDCTTARGSQTLSPNMRPSHSKIRSRS